MKARLLTITLAAVLGLLGVVAVVAYAHQANQRAVAGLKAETVLVAKCAIPAGTSLNKAHRMSICLSTEKVPVSSSVSTRGAVGDRDERASGRERHRGARPGAADEHADLGRQRHGEPGSFLIPPGMIAVTVNMCMAEAVADYVTPGIRCRGIRHAQSVSDPGFSGPVKRSIRTSAPVK